MQDWNRSSRSEMAMPVPACAKMPRNRSSLSRNAPSDLFTLRDIAHDCPHRVWPTTRISRQHRPQFYRNNGPILPLILLLVNVGVSSRYDLLMDDVLFEGMPALRCQPLVSQRANFVGRVSQHLAIKLVEFDDPAVHGDLHKGVAQVFVQHPVTRLGLAQLLLCPLAFVDILDDADEIVDSAVRFAYLATLSLAQTIEPSLRR